jgi:hypothetical protein
MKRPVKPSDSLWIAHQDAYTLTDLMIMSWPSGDLVSLMASSSHLGESVGTADSPIKITKH